MDDSRPATAAPSDGTAAPADPVPPEEKPARRRLHVPTSVVVTLLVAALSVWVAPAFSRQFEDRKQARQLQAQVAEQVALATANLGQRINTFSLDENLKKSRVPSQSQALKDYWQVKQARIDAKLRVYFSPEMRSMWLRFNNFVQRELELVRQTRYVAVGGPAEFWRHWAAMSLSGMRSEGRLFGISPPFDGPQIALDDLMGERASARARTIDSLVAWMRSIGDKIIDRLMTEDPEAFSTTRGIFSATCSRRDPLRLSLRPALPLPHTPGRSTHRRVHPVRSMPRGPSSRHTRGRWAAVRHPHLEYGAPACGRSRRPRQARRRMSLLPASL